MSPEQVKGLKTVDHRTDLWSLGAVFAELISGRRVFQGLTPYGAAAEVLSGKIRSLADLAPGTDPRIVAIVDRCLQREVSKRFSSADDVLDALSPLLTDDVPPATARSIPPPPPSLGRASIPPPASLPVINMTDDLTSEMIAKEVIAQLSRATAETNPSAAAIAPLDNVPPSFRGLPIIEETENSSIHIGLPIDLGDGKMLFSDYVRQRADGDAGRLSQPPSGPVEPVAPGTYSLSQPPPADAAAPTSRRLSQPPPADLHPPLSRRTQPPPEPLPMSLKQDKPPADLVPISRRGDSVRPPADPPPPSVPLAKPAPSSAPPARVKKSAPTSAPPEPTLRPQTKQLNLSVVIALMIFVGVTVAVVMKLLQ